MPLTPRLFAACAAIAMLLAVPRAAESAPDEASRLMALERELVAAIARGDLATYDRIVADDYVAFQASGAESTKAQVMAAYRSGSLHYTGLEIFDVEARVFGDTAVVIAKTRGLRREGDRDVPNRVRYIRVYARRGGRWQAVTQMAAPMPEERARETPTPRKGGRPG